MVPFCSFSVAHWQIPPKTSLSQILVSVSTHPLGANPIASKKINPNLVLKPISYLLLNSSLQFNLESKATLILNKIGYAEVWCVPT